MAIDPCARLPNAGGGGKRARHAAAPNWRMRAEETRTLAADMRDLVAKAAMLEIADQYDRLAPRVEHRLREQKPAA